MKDSSPSFRNVSLKSQPLFSSFGCSYVFATHLLHSWFFYTQCAEKLISPPADLCCSAPSKESAWKENLKKEQPSSCCMNFHQETENWKFKCKYHAARSHRRLILDPLHCEHTFSVADCLKYRVLSSFCSIYGGSMKRGWKAGEAQGISWPQFHLSLTHSELKYNCSWTISTMIVALGFQKWGFLCYGVTHYRVLCL